MRNRRLETVLQKVRDAWVAQAVSDVNDADLLRRFVQQRDAAAFELLLRRHERLVFGVCRRLLRDDAEAEDVFQATFLALVRKAHTIARGEAVAGWLHQVACRAARRAAALRSRRLAVVRPAAAPPPAIDGGDPQAAAQRNEVAPLLHEELSRLPEKYRAALVLCYLEGKTYPEAAVQLACPLGTLSIRLKRGRDLLRTRLVRRGLTLTAAGLATALSEQAASATAKASLVASTLTAGLRVAGGSALGDVVSPEAAALTESVIQSMSLPKLKLATAALAFVVTIGLAVRGWAIHQPPPPTEKPAPPAAMRAEAAEAGSFAIRGRVVDKAGSPVAGASVRLLAQGFNGFDVDEKTTTAAGGTFALAAPKSWTLTDASQRQELAVVAVAAGKLAVVQFQRNSSPPVADVELTLASGGDRVEVLSPDQRPVVGAKVRLVGLTGDLVREGLTEAEVQQVGGAARRTPIGHVIGSGTAMLPPDMEVDLGVTDARGRVAVPQIPLAGVGAVTVQTDEFGEQTIGHFAFDRKQPPAWARRIVLKRTGRVTGQLSGPTPTSVARREVTVGSSDLDTRSGMFHASSAKLVTDRAGGFEAAKMVPGAVRCGVTFDPAEPTRVPNETTPAPQLKAGQTLALKVELKPAVRVEGRVLEAGTRKPIRGVPVRAYIGLGFESATSDAEGKVAFWMAPGQTAFHPGIPAEYLPTLAPSDYLDQAKRYQAVGVFKVPEDKKFQPPPILLHRPGTLRGAVVNDGGRPLAGAGVSAVAMALDPRTGEPKPREVAVRTDARGEFAVPGIDPRETVRLRVTAKEGSKVVTVAKPGGEAVRVVVASSDTFRLVGRVVDAGGKPVADAVLEVWHRDWRPPPHEAAAKLVPLKEAVRGDAEGRFQTPPLPADGHYRFTIRASGARTTESAWLDATSPDSAKPQQLVVTRLGGLSGVVRDSAGKPVADAQVTLLAGETRTETATNGRGLFRLEVPAGKPYCVVVRHPDFRAQGTYYEAARPALDQTLARLTEPADRLPRRELLARDARAKLLARVLDPFKQRLAKSTSVEEKVQSLQSLTAVAPDFVGEFLDKHPLGSAKYVEMLRTQVAMKKAGQNPGEAEELIGKLEPGSQRCLAYGMLVDAMPESARARKLEVLAEALVGARAEKSPELRAATLGQVARRLWQLGERDRATAILREGEKIARGLSTSGFAGYARGAFATDLALLDLPAAKALMKGLTDRREVARHLGNTAHRVAATHPTEAVKILDLIPPPIQNEFNQRDQFGIRVGYRMAQVDLRGAIRLADSIVDIPTRAYALGVIARAVAKADPKQAAALVRRAFALLEEDAARPDPPQLTGPQTQGAVAAGLVLLAEEIDPSLVRECLWRAVLLRRPHSVDPRHAWRYTTGNSALTMAAARYDGKLAEFLLPAAPIDWLSRERPLAEALANPSRAVAAAEKAGPTKDDRDLTLITVLATDEGQLPRLILTTLGLWRIDVEDIE